MGLIPLNLLLAVPLALTPFFIPRSYQPDASRRASILMFGLSSFALPGLYAPLVLLLCWISERTCYTFVGGWELLALSVLTTPISIAIIFVVLLVGKKCAIRYLQRPNW